MDQIPTPIDTVNTNLALTSSSVPDIETIPRLSIEEAKLKTSKNIN